MGGGDPPPTPSEPRSTLGVDGSLAPGERIISPNKQYSLVMQAGDGNLVLYRGSTPLWAAGAAGAGARAVMQGDGNLVVYNGSTPQWSSNTAGFRGATLTIQDDGNLVVYHGGRGVWTWSSGYIGQSLGSGQALPPGAMVRSPNGRYWMVMQGDGNLVLYRDNTALWATGGTGAGSRAAMQGDGNLVVYDGPTPRWSSNTADFGGAVLQVQDDGNAVIYHNNRGIWTWGSGYIGDRLNAGAVLTPGAYLKSADHRFMLVMQASDGNLVEYGPTGAVWAWDTAGNPGAYAVQQTDGNFVVYRGSTALRATGTAGRPGAFIVLQNDDNLVVYSGSSAVWSRKDLGGLQLPWPAGQSHRILSVGNGYGCDTHVGRSQYAIDFDVTTGQPVAATAAGTARAGDQGDAGLGRYVWIDHGGGLVSVYAHLSGFSGGYPRQVARGETIGAAGNTGYSFGAHLHFVIRAGATGPFDGNAYLPEPMSGYSGFGAFGCGRGTSPSYVAR